VSFGRQFAVAACPLFQHRTPTGALCFLCTIICVGVTRNFVH
jgi:hypothetical protein